MRYLLTWLVSCFLGALLLVSPLSAEAASSLPPDDDTIERSVTAGNILIVALPDALDNTPVEGYRIVEAPALSGLADRSFFWRTQADDAGTHRILFHANRAEAPADTLTLRVTVDE